MLVSLWIFIGIFWMHSATAFAPIHIIMIKTTATTRKQQPETPPPGATTPTRLFLSQPPPPPSCNNESSLLTRFTNPVIDDPWLPLTEAGLAQIVAPSLQLFWLASAHSPSFPSWANPIVLSSDAAAAVYWDQLPRGSFLAPTLIHGAGLACCWLLGALASNGYQEEAFEGDFGTVCVSTLKAGAFSVGLLIVATQLDLLRHYGYIQVGDSPETDMRLYRAFVEVINDCFFEAMVLLAWRFYRRAAGRGII